MCIGKCNEFYCLFMSVFHGLWIRGNISISGFQERFQPFFLIIYKLEVKAGFNNKSATLLYPF